MISSDSQAHGIFLSTPSARRATCVTVKRLESKQFLSTPPARRATARPAAGNVQKMDFYPRPPRGGRPGGRAPEEGTQHFYPRPPRGGRPIASVRARFLEKFLSTPSARRATIMVKPPCLPRHISIHALREEGDGWLRATEVTHNTFLSTPSARRATGRDLSGRQQLGYFYPRPPRGGRRARVAKLQHKGVISIHALREEGDRSRPLEHGSNMVFLSTPSARRATEDLPEEWTDETNFYPRPPRGGRPMRCVYGILGVHFYPRPPRGGRLDGGAVEQGVDIISIHALREEGDTQRVLCAITRAKFLSTPSARRATGGCCRACKHPRVFLSTPSARRATFALCALDFLRNYFYPRPPRGGRLVRAIPAALSFPYFYPRPPRGGRPWAQQSTGYTGDYFYPRPPRGGRL